MDSSQDELGINNENNRTIFLRESDPFLPVIPWPEIKDEPLEEGLNRHGLNTPPVTPLIPPTHFSRKTDGYFHLHLC